MPVSHHDGIGIVLLAAGESRRMAAASETPTTPETEISSQTPAASETNSSQATPKALLPWLGRPLIQYQLEQIAALGAAQDTAHVVVVTGFHAKRLMRPTLSLSRAYALWKTPIPREAELLQSCTA